MRFKEFPPEVLKKMVKSVGPCPYCKVRPLIRSKQHCDSDECKKGYYHKSYLHNIEYYRKYRQAHKEERNEYSRVYYIKNKELVSKKKLEYYQANKEAVKERVRAYRQANREKILKSSRAYYHKMKMQKINK